jgi:signal transduction histidine kinase
LVWNLVRNAVQASSPGGNVTVSVEEDEKTSSIKLTVSDQGPGIDDEAKEKIFDPLFTTRSHGTGIGLAVVKRIADEHGFAINVNSQTGKGAIFTVTLGQQKRNSKLAG